MAARQGRQGFPPEVRAVLDATGKTSPEVAVRELAQRALADYVAVFPDEAPPHHLEALASFRSIRVSGDPPVFSEDAELVPDGKGGAVMRLNTDRPRTRQRFSIGHEIGHTLFPGFESTVHCRKGPNHDWAERKDLVEYLCDVAASEFLFPEPWFRDEATALVGTAEEIIALAQKYQASPDATVRRFVEVRTDPHAVIFFRWKLKPTERRRADAKNQTYMFGSRKAFQPERKLRVEYSIANDLFDSLGHHVPTDKSVAEHSVIMRASVEAECLDATETLDLGPLSGRFYVRVFPLYTAEKDIGPNGERSVAALISPAKAGPVKVRRRPK